MRTLDSNPVRLMADFIRCSILHWRRFSSFPCPLFARLLEWLVPEPAASTDPSTPIYLDAAAISTPSLALTCAARETLHMGDLIETMLRRQSTR